jgi:hypothetical protein
MCCCSSKPPTANATLRLKKSEAQDLLSNCESIHSHRIPYILYVNDNSIPGTIYNDRNVLANILYNSSSTEGHFHVQYLVLLERFARYIRTSPNLLHKLVDQYERQIYGLLNISDIHKSRVHDLGKHQYAHSEKYDSTSFNPDNTTSHVDRNNIQTYDDLNGFNFSNSINIMPLLRQLGVKILHKDDKNEKYDSSDSDSDSDSESS